MFRPFDKVHIGIRHVMGGDEGCHLGNFCILSELPNHRLFKLQINRAHPPPSFPYSQAKWSIHTRYRFGRFA